MRGARNWLRAARTQLMAQASIAGPILLLQEAASDMRPAVPPLVSPPSLFQQLPWFEWEEMQKYSSKSSLQPLKNDLGCRGSQNWEISMR